jgi:molybdopterin-binding protein
MAVILVLIYNDQTENIDFSAALNDYCCIFDEICKVVKETFNLNNLLDNYNMVYFDQAYNLWINFNIHVTKHISQIIRRPTSRTLKIRVEQRQRNTVTSFIRKNTVDEVNFKPTKGDSKSFPLVIRIRL